MDAEEFSEVDWVQVLVVDAAKRVLVGEESLLEGGQHSVVGAVTVDHLSGDVVAIVKSVVAHIDRDDFEIVIATLMLET